MAFKIFDAEGNELAVGDKLKSKAEGNELPLIEVIEIEGDKIHFKWLGPVEKKPFYLRASAMRNTAWRKIK